MAKRVRLSKISALHYAKLVLRSSLLIAMLVFYIINRAKAVDAVKNSPHILTVIWIIFVVEMVLRFSRRSLKAWAVKSNLSIITSRLTKALREYRARQPQSKLGWLWRFGSFSTVRLVFFTVPAFLMREL